MEVDSRVEPTDVGRRAKIAPGAAPVKEQGCAGHAPAGRDQAAATLNREIARIDDLLNAQVNAILHHPRFQRLEASWRGLQYLVETMIEAGPGAPDAKVRILSVTWPELCRDAERAMDVVQSSLFAKVHNEEFGTPGGEPYGLLIGDYEVSHRRTADRTTDDVTMLRSASDMAAAAFAPFVVGASPALLGLERFADLGRPMSLADTFRHSDYQRWRDLQDSENARFLGVTLPRVLMRLPYPDDGPNRHGFRFSEDVTAPDGSAYLWGTAVYAFAGVVIRAFATSGWLADIRGTRRDRLDGGLVTGLPIPSFATESPGIALTYSTDVSIGDRQEKELSELGLIALCKEWNTEYSVFHSNPSVQIPRRHESTAATVNARLSAMLQYNLCISCFAHTIKVIGRNRIGSIQSPEEFQSVLQRWLGGYLIGNDDASLETRARYPLREADVEVRLLPGKPGSYACTLYLRPHFQLDDVATTLRLVTQLASPQPAA